MSTPILATKLYIPPSQLKVVLRARLFEKLNDGLHHKLTLIAAPAGFGKTTLLSEWAGCCERPVAWLSLDKGDNNLTRFLAYLIAAFQTIAETMGAEMLSALQSLQPPPTESILIALLNEITTTSKNFTLILDDYHVIDSTEIDKALAFLLDHLPPQIHLVIATRENPQLPLARLRAQGQVTELRTADLRFSPTEAAGFLNEMMGLNLSTEDIDALETRTEGWIAGLQLAAISMQGHQDVTSFIKVFTGSHRFVMDYLVEEVLQQQLETVQNFLLHTSILDRLCGPLCDAILQDPSANGQKILETIEQANLFIIPLDNERLWYRYHHLFAELLRQRLHQSMASSRGNKGSGVAQLHIRASIWYENNGLDNEAFHHALAAEDFERGARLAELVWSEMYKNSFQNTTFLGWVKVLPDALIRARPVLSVGYAWALLDFGELEDADARLKDAERWLDTTSGRSKQKQAGGMVVVDKEAFRSLPAIIALARSYLSQAHGDVAGTVKQAQQALALLPEGEHLWRGTAAALLGLAYWSCGDLEAAHRSFVEGMSNMKRAGNLQFALSATFALADIRIAQGRLHDAMRTYEQSLQLATEQGEPLLEGTADLYIGLGDLHREQGHLEKAQQFLLRGEALGEKAGLPDWQYRFRLAQARLKQAQGDLDGALDMLTEAEKLYQISPLPDFRPVAALKTRVWVQRGCLTEALAWMRQQDLSPHDNLSFLHEFEHITLAKVLIAHYKNERKDDFIHEALGLVERLLNTAEKGNRTGSVIEILVLKAFAHEAQGDISAALLSLEQSLTLAEKESYVRIFIDEGIPMAKLLAIADAQEIMSDYVNQLLRVFQAQDQKTEDPPPSGHPLIEPLSGRELEVLHLIAQGLSNREIGERLFLALSTVKGHNRNIFGKLQVQRRTEAISRSRELGLLA